jgi:hypothetical protein
MTKIVTVRVPDDLREWLDGYAKERGVDRSTVLLTAIASFREDCQGGTPDLRVRPAPARRAGPPSREGFAQAAVDRTELFRRLRTPDSIKATRPRPSSRKDRP